MSGWWAASYVVLWLLVAVLCIVVVALARQIGTLHLRLGPRGALEINDEGPPLGEAPTRRTVTDLTGSSLEVGGPGASQLIAFATPNCHLCAQVLPSIPVVARPRKLTPVVVFDADADEARSETRSWREGVHVVASSRLAHSYRVPGTPYVVVLDQFGIVRAKGTVNDLEQLEGLVDTAFKRAIEARGPRDPMPRGVV